jgi:hypothetical protein
VEARPCLHVTKPTACNRLAMVVGGVSWKGGSWKIAKLTAIVRLNMEETCILCYMIESFWQRKVTKVENESFVHFKLQMALAQSCKNTLHVCVSNQKLQLLREELINGVSIAIAPWLNLSYIEGNKSGNWFSCTILCSLLVVADKRRNTVVHLQKRV